MLGNEHRVARALAPSLRDLSSEGLSACLRRAGVKLASAQQTIGARIADRTDAENLDIEPGAALLTMQRTAYDETGRAIELGDHVDRALCATASGSTCSPDPWRGLAVEHSSHAAAPPGLRSRQT